MTTEALPASPSVRPLSVSAWWSNARAVWKLCRAMVADGGVAVVTPGGGNGAPAAKTVIQPDGDIVVFVSTAAREQPALLKQHRADVAAALRPLLTMGTTLDAVTHSRVWGAVPGVASLAPVLYGASQVQGRAMSWAILWAVVGGLGVLARPYYPPVVRWVIGRLVRRLFVTRAAA